MSTGPLVVAPSGPWVAPTVEHPVEITITLPGSKSLTNRAYVLAALADGPGRIVRPLRARDTALMAGALIALGSAITDDGDDVVVTPAPLRGPATIDVGNAGTVMRFVPPLAALADGPVHFDGDPRSHERPLGEVIGALRALVVDRDAQGRGALPLTVHGSGSVSGGVVTIDASASSQFVSALLLAAPRFERGITVRHQGPPVPSQPHIDMTVEVLRARGIQVDTSRPNQWIVAPATIPALDVVIEPDLSNAAPFLAAALVTGGTVTIPGWPLATTQPGDALRGLLVAMGATAVLDGRGLTVSGTGEILGIETDLHDVGELTPVLAALCALAVTPSRLRGIRHLRGHETDRLAALAAQLGGLGAVVTDTEDGLAFLPARLHGGRFATFDDHRLATAAAVVGLAVPGVQLDDVATTAKTMPEFVSLWSALVASARMGAP